MANLPIENFLGLRRTQRPEAGTAYLTSNVKRNRVRGRIEVADGYEVELALPADDATRLISSVSIKAIHSAYIPDDGGRTVRIAVGTYTATSQEPVSVVNTSGIWMRPYHNGTAWVDAWRELTEFYKVQLSSASGTTVVVSNKGRTIQTADYFAGFRIMESLSSAVDSGAIVVSNTEDTETLTLTTATAVTSYGWTAGDTLYLVRSLAGAVLPAALTPVLRSLFDEVRFTTGSGSTDLNLAVFYRDKTLFQGYERAYKGTFCERSSPICPDGAAFISDLTHVGAPTGGLAEGEYTLRSTLVLDDGQESEFITPVGSSSPVIAETVNSGAISGAYDQVATLEGRLYVPGFYSSTVAGPEGILELDPSTLTTLASKTFAGEKVIGLDSYGGFLYVTTSRALDHSIVIRRLASSMAESGSLVYPVETLDIPTTAKVMDQYLWVACGGTANRVFMFSPYSLIYVDQFPMPLPVTALLAASTSRLFVATTASSPFQVQSITIASYDITSFDLAGATARPAFGTIYDGKVYITAGGDVWEDSSTAPDGFTVYKGAIGTSLGGLLADAGVLYVNTNDSIDAYLISSGALIATGSATNSVGEIGNTIAILSAGEFACITSIGRVRRYTYRAGDVSGKIYSGGFISGTYKLYVSPGLCPIRAQLVRVYISKDGGPYYLMAEHDIRDAGISFTTSAFVASLSHWYYSTAAVAFGSTEADAATESAIGKLGRATSDDGEAVGTSIITVNNVTYLAGRTISGKFQRNRVYLGCRNSDGLSMYDVLPNDADYVIDLEFNDGDYIRALVPAGDRVLALKDRSAVLLTPGNDGSHSRDVVSIGVGVASIKSIVTWGDVAIWLDHSGVYQFSASGLSCLSDAIFELLDLESEANRSAAVAGLDPKNHQYRLCIGTKIYVLDLKDGEWLIETPHSGCIPTWYTWDAGAQGRRYLQLSGSNILKPTSAKLHNGQAFTFNWESSRIEVPGGRGLDSLLTSVYVEYSSDVDLTLELFLDDDSSAARSYTLKSTAKGLLAPAPIASRCKSFRLKISGTISAASKAAVITRMGAYYNVIPVGGDGGIF